MGDVVIVMEGKVEEEKLKIEVKIEGEEETRELAEGAILWSPTIKEVRVKIYKEGEKEGGDLKLVVGKENVVLGEAIELLSEHEGIRGKAHIKGEEGKREREYLKGDQKQEDVVIVMEGKVEEEKLK